MCMTCIFDIVPTLTFTESIKTNDMKTMQDQMYMIVVFNSNAKSRELFSYKFKHEKP